jgi:hypothetical protein
MLLKFSKKKTVFGGSLWSSPVSNRYACSFSEGKKIVFCHIGLCLLWISFFGLDFVVLELYCF